MYEFAIAIAIRKRTRISLGLPWMIGYAMVAISFRYDDVVAHSFEHDLVYFIYVDVRIVRFFLLLLFNSEEF